MNTIEKEKMDKIFEEVKLLPTSSAFRICFWAMFRPKKFKMFVGKLDLGMHRKFAYEDTKNSKHEK